MNRASMKQEGYSLMETMVVVAIIGIMTIVIGPSYASYQRGKALSYGRTLIINETRYVQDSALTGLKYSRTGITQKGGYGIYFEKNATYFKVFVDVDEDKAYDPVTEYVETVNLTGNVKISDLNAGSSINAASYVCVPPYGKGYINASGSATLDITLQSTQNSAAVAHVTIGSSGYTN
jgi:prepilin-type N-terminal cleavage/methylation domain-containing protein